MPQDHFYSIKVVSRHSDGSVTALDTWEGLATSHVAAINAARDGCWDSRFDAAGSKPEYEGGIAKRFLVSPGWDHFLPGNARTTSLRFALDRAHRQIIVAQRSSGTELSRDERDDLMDSLNDNEIWEKFDDFGVDDTDTLPQWATAVWDEGTFNPTERATETASISDESRAELPRPRC